MVLSEGLEKLERGTFKGCKMLKNVQLQQGITCIEDYCFCDTGIERIALPKTLQQIGYRVLSGRKNLSIIYVEDGLEEALTRLQVPDSVQVGPLPEMRVRGSRVWDLRRAKNLVLPDDIELVGSCWFWGSGVERVEIPASVEKIGACAFYNCGKLGELVFHGTQTGRAESSAGGTVPSCTSSPDNCRLKVIGREAFYKCTGLEQVQLPDGL